jgi:hypothetical protein
MVSLFVVVRHELVDGAEQSPPPKQDQTVETLLPDRAHEALRVGVGIRRLDGCRHDPHARPLDDAVEAVRPLGVPVADEDAMAGQKSIDRIGQSTRRLAMNPPSGVGVDPPREPVGFGDRARTACSR